MYRDEISIESAYFTDDPGAWIISGPRLVPIQDAPIEDVARLPRNRCGEVFGLRSGRP